VEERTTRLCADSYEGRRVWAAEEAAGDLAHSEWCRFQRHPQEASWSVVVEGEEEVRQRRVRLVHHKTEPVFVVDVYFFTDDFYILALQTAPP